MIRTTPQAGFTLIETLIAIAVLTLAVVGPLYTASRSIVAAQTANDQLTASYLAQEGIEYVRAMRDYEFLSFYKAANVNVSSAAWTDFVSGSGVGSIARCRTTACAYDPYYTMASGNSLTPCSGGVCTPLYLVNNIYTEQSSIAGAVRTPFTRSIQAYDVTGNEERIVSTVSWSFHGIPYSVMVTDHLTSWQ